jgi:DNA-binding PadR family transcriptional regulator
MSKLRIILEVIGVANFIGVRPTGNQIAQIAKGWKSRATVYRLLKKAEEFGLVERIVTRYGTEWRVTKHGKEWLETWQKLPF